MKELTGATDKISTPMLMFSPKTIAIGVSVTAKDIKAKRVTAPIFLFKPL